jgi:hypothetical protein
VFRLPDRADRASEAGSETNELAIASLLLAVVWIFGIGSAVAIVLAVRGLGEIEASNGTERGRSLAVAALFVGAGGVLGAALLLAVALFIT